MLEQTLTAPSYPVHGQDVATFHDESFFSAWQQAADWAGPQGRVATLPEACRIVLSQPSLQRKYIYTLSSELETATKDGKPVVLVLHGVGPLADEASYRNAILAADKQHLSGTYLLQKMARSLLNGKHKGETFPVYSASEFQHCTNETRGFGVVVDGSLAKWNEEDLHRGAPSHTSRLGSMLLLARLGSYEVLAAYCKAVPDFVNHKAHFHGFQWGHPIAPLGIDYVGSIGRDVHTTYGEKNSPAQGRYLGIHPPQQPRAIECGVDKVAA